MAFMINGVKGGSPGMQWRWQSLETGKALTSRALIMFKRCFSKLLECPRANSDEFDMKFLSDEKCHQDQN